MKATGIDERIMTTLSGSPPVDRAEAQAPGNRGCRNGHHGELDGGNGRALLYIIPHTTKPQGKPDGDQQHEGPEGKHPARDDGQEADERQGREGRVPDALYPGGVSLPVRHKMTLQARIEECIR